MSKPASKMNRGPAQDDSDDDDSTSSSKQPAGPYRTDPKGDELKKEAEKKLGKFTLFSGNQKYEDAIELFEKAAAQYKMNKNWQEAGEVYVRCAEIYHTNLKEAHDEGVAYENAAKAFKNVNLKEAIRCYTAAVEILKENNKFSMSAKIYKEMGALQEKEHDHKGAQQSYNKAADCYEADNSAANASAMWIKVAGLAAESGDYQKAIKIYEQVAKTSLENSALRWSVKGYLFKALLCHFVLASKSHRLEGVSLKLENYVDMCPDLDNSREKGLIEDLIEDFNENDSDKFAEHVFGFDEIVKLDNWSAREDSGQFHVTAKVLLEIKKALEAGNPDDNAVGV